MHAACRNGAAVAAISPMLVQCRRFWYAYQHHGDIPEGCERHKQLARAVAEGRGEDAVAAADLLMDYLRRFAQNVID
jgi:DNA-binding GntR family transcriptional regulator